MAHYPDATFTRRGLLIGAAAVPAALSLPSLGLADDYDLYLYRMTAETCRALIAVSLAPCPVLPEGPIVLRCGLR